jgi:hypothetical protein
VAGHDHRYLHVRGIAAQVGNQSLRESLHRELGGGASGMGPVWPQRSPESIDAARVDELLKSQLESLLLSLVVTSPSIDTLGLFHKRFLPIFQSIANL